MVIFDYVCGHCHLAFMPKFNYPPMVGITAFNDITMPLAMMRGVLTPSITSHYAYQYLKLGFLDRIENYVMQFADYMLRDWYLYPMQDAIIREQARMPGIPPVSKISYLTKLILINHDPAIDTPEQLPPNIIGVGGMQIKSAQPLPEVMI